MIRISAINLFSMANKVWPALQCKRFLSNPYENPPIFKSTYSLDNVYSKNSTEADNKSQEEASDQQFTGHIPMNKLKISYCRSSGPGGQHVNTTDTKATIQFHLASADWMPLLAREKLAIIHKNNINKKGEWIIRSDKTRSQLLNVADCLDKLRCYITEATQPIPKPSFETLEMIRKRREKSEIERLEQKRRRSLMKAFKNSID